MHCNYEFHLAMGMVALFIIEDSPTVVTSLPPPPSNVQTYCNCDDTNLVPDELCFQSNELKLKPQ
jgi:laccase